MYGMFHTENRGKNMFLVASDGQPLSTFVALMMSASPPAQATHSLHSTDHKLANVFANRWCSRSSETTVGLCQGNGVCRASLRVGVGLSR